MKCGDILMAVKVRLYFFAVFSILVMLSFRCIAISPLVGGFHDWRKVLMHAWGWVMGGATASIRISVILA